MLYEKLGTLLEESDKYIYQEELYLCFPKRWELYSSKKYCSSVPVDKKDACAFSKEYQCMICRNWELIAAPIDYLKNNNYKLKV